MPTRNVDDRTATRCAVWLIIATQFAFPSYSISSSTDPRGKPIVTLREQVTQRQIQAIENEVNAKEVVTAQAAARLSAVLKGNQTSRNLQTYAQNQTGAIAGNAIEKWLSQFGNAQAGLTTDHKGRAEGSYLDMLVPLFDTQHDMLYSQTGIRRADDRSMVNIGLGYRHWFNDSMVGTNLFYDRDISHNHDRLGVGIEYAKDYLKLSTNGYFRLSGWKTSPDMPDYMERPANGFDVRTQAWLPSYPQLSGKLVYARYYGNEVGVFGRHAREKNPEVLSAGLSYTPVPLVTFSADHQMTTGQGNTDTRVGINLSYAFGIPLSAQLDADNVSRSRLLSGQRYDLVDRNNIIVLEYKKKQVVELTLPAQLSGEEMTALPLEAKFNARHAVLGVEWYGDAFFMAGGDILYDGQGYVAMLPEWREDASNEYVLYATAWDVKGNMSKPARITLNVLPKVLKISVAGDITGEEGQIIPLGLNARAQHNIAKVEWDAAAFETAGGEIRKLKSSSTSINSLNYSVMLPPYKQGGDNKYPLKVTLSDVEGNVSNEASLAVTVTPASTVVNLAPEFSGQESSNTLIPLEITSKNGIDRIEWLADTLYAAGGAITENGGKYYVQLPAWQEGQSNSYVLTVVVYDKNGGASRPVQTTVSVSSRAITLSIDGDIIDEEGKIIKVVPKIESINGLQKIDVKADAFINAGGKIDVEVESATLHLPVWQPATSNRYMLSIQATDARGFKSAWVSFSVEVKPVLVTVTLPAEIKGKERENVALKVAVDAIRGIDHIEINADTLISAGGAIQGSGVDYQITLPPYKKASSNQYPVTVTAWDNGGKASVPAVTTVHVEQQPVTLELISNVTAIESSSRAFTPSVTSVIGLDRIDWQAAEFLAAGGKITGSGNTYTFTFPGYIVGNKNTYGITATAVDKNGTTSDPATMQVVVTSRIMDASGQCDVLGGGEGYGHGIDKSTVSYVEATDFATLKSMVNRGEKYIYIPPGVVIDVPNQSTALLIKAGTTIFSDRGIGGSEGGLLRVPYTGETENKYPVIMMQSNSRMSGLRYEGPYKGTVTTNVTIGIQTTPNSVNVEIDNMELWGWPWSAVNVKKTKNARVHHSFIHDNIRAGLGYGVVVQNGNATVEVACNVFNANRHAIAGQGAPGEGYYAHHNLVLNGGGSGAYHQFDMHDDPDADGNLIGGEFLDIRYNLFDYGRWGTAVRNSIVIRGQPTRGPAIVTDNWFSQPWATGGAKQVSGRYGLWIPTEAEILDTNYFSVPMDYINLGSNQCVVNWASYSQSVYCPSVGF